jgi:hypothetical protein
VVGACWFDLVMSFAKRDVTDVAFVGKAEAQRLLQGDEMLLPWWPKPKGGSAKILINILILNVFF